jgi:hypothetical protein
MLQPLGASSNSRLVATISLQNGLAARLCLNALLLVGLRPAETEDLRPAGAARIWFISAKIFPK